MPGQTAHWSDRRTGVWIGSLLRWGVLLAAAVAFAGMVLHLAVAGGQPVDYSSFHGVSPGLDSAGGVLLSVRAFRTDGLIQLGILLLVATPVLRVVLSLAAFTLQRDRTYVMITLLVLGVLLYSLLGPGTR